MTDIRDATRCPKCDADWDNGPIAEDMREHYSPPYRWSRRIALIDQGRDRQYAVRCPDCGAEFPV